MYYHNNSSTYGVTTTSCDGGLFNATTPGGLDTLMESLKNKAGAANVSCIASSTGWAIGVKLKNPGTACVDGKGGSKASTTQTSATSSYSAALGNCL